MSLKLHHVTPALLTLLVRTRLRRARVLGHGGGNGSESWDAWRWWRGARCRRAARGIGLGPRCGSWPRQRGADDRRAGRCSGRGVWGTRREK